MDNSKIKDLLKKLILAKIDLRKAEAIYVPGLTEEGKKRVDEILEAGAKGSEYVSDEQYNYIKEMDTPEFKYLLRHPGLDKQSRFVLRGVTNNHRIGLPEIQHWAVDGGGRNAIWTVFEGAQATRFPPDLVVKLLESPNPEFRRQAIKKANHIPKDVMRKLLIQDDDEGVRYAAAEHGSLADYPDLIREAWDEGTTPTSVRTELISNAPLARHLNQDSLLDWIKTHPSQDFINGEIATRLDSSHLDGYIDHLNDRDNISPAPAIEAMSKNPDIEDRHISKMMAGNLAPYVVQSDLAGRISSQDLMNFVKDPESGSVAFEALYLPQANQEHFNALFDSQDLDNMSLTVADALLNNKYATSSHIERALNSSNESVRDSAIRSPLATDEQIDHAAQNEIHSDLRHTARNIAKKRRESLPSYFFANPGDYNDPQFSGTNEPRSSDINAHKGFHSPKETRVKFDTTRIRKLRDHIESMGGTVRPSQINAFGVPILPEWKSPDGKVEAHKIQHWIDAQPDNIYNTSHTWWGGAQRHSLDSSKVLQVNLTDDHVKQLRKEGLAKTWKTLNDLSNQSGHPVNPHTLGWVRYTGDKDKGFFIDEVQSDLGQNLVRMAEAQAREAGWDDTRINNLIRETKEKFPAGHLERIQQIVFGNRHPSEVLHETFQQHLRDEGMHGTPVHVHTVTSKAPISALDPKKPAPIHFQEGYSNIPKKKLGMSPKTYGELPTQVKPHPSYQHTLITSEGGAPTLGDQVRKFEEILERLREYKLAKDEAPEGAIPPSPQEDEIDKKIEEGIDHNNKAKIMLALKMDGAQPRHFIRAFSAPYISWYSDDINDAVKDNNNFNKSVFDTIVGSGDVSDAKKTILLSSYPDYVDEDNITKVWDGRDQDSSSNTLREFLAENGKTPPSIVEAIARSSDGYIRRAAYRNPNLPTEFIKESFEKAIKPGANHWDNQKVKELLSHADISPGMLGEFFDEVKKNFKSPEREYADVSIDTSLNLAMNLISNLNFPEEKKSEITKAFLSNREAPGLRDLVIHMGASGLLGAEDAGAILDSGDRHLVDVIATSKTPLTPEQIDKIVDKYKEDPQSIAYNSVFEALQRPTVGQNTVADLIDSQDHDLIGAVLNNEKVTNKGHLEMALNALQGQAKDQDNSLIRAMMHHPSADPDIVKKLAEKGVTAGSILYELSSSRRKTLLTPEVWRAFYNKSPENTKRFISEATFPDDLLLTMAKDGNYEAADGVARKSKDPAILHQLANLDIPLTDQYGDAQSMFDVYDRIAGNENVSRETLHTIIDKNSGAGKLTGLPDATQLALENKKLTSEDIDGIIAKYPQLERYVHYNPNLTPQQIQRIYPKLHDDDPDDRPKDIRSLPFARHPNAPTEIVQHHYDTYPHIYESSHHAENLINHPNVPLDVLLSFTKDKKFKAKAEEKLKENHPDLAHKEKVNAKIGTGRMRKLRDFILQTGKGEARPKDLPQNLVAIGQKARLPNGNISAQKLQELIDLEPHLSYNVSHGSWDGVQRHNQQNSKAFQVNMTNEHVKKLKEAGVWETWKKLRGRYIDSHPVTNSTIGWVRYTDSPPPPDEAELQEQRNNWRYDFLHQAEDLYQSSGDYDPDDTLKHNFNRLKQWARYEDHNTGPNAEEHYMPFVNQIRQLSGNDQLLSDIVNKSPVPYKDTRPLARRVQDEYHSASNVINTHLDQIMGKYSELSDAANSKRRENYELYQNNPQISDEQKAANKQEEDRLSQEARNYYNEVYIPTVKHHRDLKEGFKKAYSKIRGNAKNIPEDVKAHPFVQLARQHVPNAFSFFDEKPTKKPRISKKKKSKDGQWEDPTDGIFIDEIQSDFAVDSVKKAASSARRDAMETIARRPDDYKTEEDKVNFINERMKNAADAEEAEVPSAHQAKIREILFGGHHGNRVLVEAFMQHLRDKGNIGQPVHIHTLETKLPISLPYLKEGDDPGAHFKVTYRDIPKELDINEPKVYGELKTQQKPIRSESKHLKPTDGPPATVQGGVVRKTETTEDNLHGQGIGSESQIIQDMLGFAPQLHATFQAAKFFGHGKELTLEQARKALYDADGDYAKAALMAYHLPVTEDTIKAIYNVMKIQGLKKFEDSIRVQSVDPGHPDAQKAVDAIRRAHKSGMILPVKLSGKHASGALIAKDEDKSYLLKPGSGLNSPAAGVRQDTASQSAREAAFSKVADKWGLGEYVPDAALVIVDGRQYAALDLLPWSYQTMERIREKDAAQPHRLLRGAVITGLAHKWAALDYILGNPDRHGQNIMVGDGGEIALIDHGSAFAGSEFNPATDKYSFVPFYLRADAPRNFHSLPEEEKLYYMPRVTKGIAEELKGWINGLRPESLDNILSQYGIDSGPAKARLEKLQWAVQTYPADEAINKVWASSDQGGLPQDPDVAV